MTQGIVEQSGGTHRGGERTGARHDLPNLPAHRYRCAGRCLADRTSASARNRWGGETVLVVEDQAEVRKYAAEVRWRPTATA